MIIPLKNYMNNMITILGHNCHFVKKEKSILVQFERKNNQIV